VGDHRGDVGLVARLPDGPVPTASSALLGALVSLTSWMRRGTSVVGTLEVMIVRHGS
jgi:hypothetical protein